ADIPIEEKIPRSKPEQLQAVRSGAAVLDVAGLSSFLAALRYPLHFLDFETIGYGIPRFAGMAPYDQLPFQYSCHVLESPQATLQHREYLAAGSGDCRPELAERLLADLGRRGSILAFNQGFEKARLVELAAFLPECAAAVEQLLDRFVDLKDAFTKYYYHPEFHGSFSLKDVLPVLVPTMSYAGMAVADGVGAQAAYARLGDEKTPTSEKQALRQNLLEYCRQDTFAMVALLRALEKRVAEV
ncbi:MAG: DUF2779 domain-containing protein, partial [Bdellovibrionales bacterium]|nr:DUF2779 domain-containing protein [Bdellovibrionales bacterium]